MPRARGVRMAGSEGANVFRRRYRISRMDGVGDKNDLFIHKLLLTSKSLSIGFYTAVLSALTCVNNMKTIILGRFRCFSFACASMSDHVCLLCICSQHFHSADWRSTVSRTIRYVSCDAQRMKRKQIIPQ